MMLMLRWRKMDNRMSSIKGKGKRETGRRAHKMFKTTPHLSGKFTATDFTLEGPLPRMNPIVHLQGTLAAQHPVANHALVGLPHLVRDVVHQLLPAWTSPTSGSPCTAPGSRPGRWSSWAGWSCPGRDPPTRARATGTGAGRGCHGDRASAPPGRRR